MLAELRISGLGVIESAVIEPAPGLTVVTGETGAGKTMIVTALGLVCGGRGDSGRVRAGVKAAVVEARFSPQPVGNAVGPSADPGSCDAQVASLLAEAADAVGGDVDDDGSLLAVRSVSADGRSRAHIGGRSAPVSALGTLTENLVAVHGQAEAMSLLHAAQQREVLDRFAGIDAELTHYRTVRAALLEVRAEIARRTASTRDRAERETLLTLGLEEIARIDPQPGEDVRIAAEIRRLDDADALRQAAAAAMVALDGSATVDGADDSVGATHLIQQALRTLDGASDEALHARVDDLRGALAVAADVSAELGAYLQELDADPARLQALLERQSMLRGLLRKYGDDVDAVLAWAETARTELAELDTSESAMDALRAEEQARLDELRTAAATVTRLREAAAKRLGTGATEELRHLAMGRATLRVRVSPLPEPGADGADQVDILLTAHEGAPELPAARSASGGELSRIMLALEVVLAGADPVSTFVFDEVDAGVGGRAATEIGSRLARLARDHQVIVVTHLAQVAAYADRHFVVDADASGSVGVSAVRQLDDDGRVAELARMLGGTDGATALAHAAELRAAATSS